MFRLQGSKKKKKAPQNRKKQTLPTRIPPSASTSQHFKDPLDSLPSSDFEILRWVVSNFQTERKKGIA